VKAETRSPESFLRVWLRDGGPSIVRGHNSERIILEGHLLWNVGVRTKPDVLFPEIEWRRSASEWIATINSKFGRQGRF
jgi:hypothetical protein